MTEQVLRFTRVFDAPRQLVFSCMVEPGHLTHFWGPIGVSAPLDQITVDARPGGAFTTVMVNDADGSTYSTGARYLEVSAPERLSWIEDHSGMTVTATFTLQVFTLDVGMFDDDDSTVSSSPPGIDCFPNCSTSYNFNQVVTLTPHPDVGVGDIFLGWSGDCQGTGACILTMTRNMSVGAAFGAPPPTLAVTVSKAFKRGESLAMRSR